MPTNEKQRKNVMQCIYDFLFKKHWIATWFGIGLISYAVISVTIYWLLMHGFSVSESGSYDRATTVATIIQATLAAAGLLAVSAALLAIARNTDRTYKQQLEQQKWQRREEFTKLAENVLQKGFETYAEICHGVFQQIGINIAHFPTSQNNYLVQIQMHEWDATIRKQVSMLYTNLHARVIAHSPFWMPEYDPEDGKPLNLRLDAESATIPLCALTACQAFTTSTMTEKTWDQVTLDAIHSPDLYGNPLAPWLDSSYYSIFTNDLLKTAPFPALLALVDMIPSLLNIVAYLEQYHLADMEDHSDSPDHQYVRCKQQLVRFEQYLRIPSLKPLCEIHGITEAEGLWDHLNKELRARGQVTAVKSNDTLVSTYQLSETRKKELGFWFGPYEVFFSNLYDNIFNRAQNNKQDTVTVNSYDDWFNPKGANIKVDEITRFYRYGLPDRWRNIKIRDEIIILEKNHVIEKYKAGLSAKLPPDQFQLAMEGLDDILKRAKAGEAEAVARWNQIKNDLNDP